MEVINGSLPEEGSYEGWLHGVGNYRPAGEYRPVMVIMPGGGYRFLSQRENEAVAAEYFRLGFQVFVLYSTVRDVENDGGEKLGITPLLQLSTLVVTIRERAEEWRVDSKRVALIGFSAGAHLAGSLGILWNHRRLKEAMQRDVGRENRPDAVIMCYPVVSGGELGHKGSFYNLTGSGDASPDRELFTLECQVTPDSSPMFIWHTQEDDTVPAENSLMLAAALQKCKVPMELHIFTFGGHGLSLCREEMGSSEKYPGSWVELSIKWLGRQLGITF